LKSRKTDFSHLGLINIPMIRVVDGRLDLEQFERVITMAY